MIETGDRRIPRWLAVAGVLVGAIVAGALLGALVTVVAGIGGKNETSPVAEPTSSPAAASGTFTPTESPSPSIAPSASESPVESAVPSNLPPSGGLQTPAVAVEQGCFAEGMRLPQGQPTDPIVAEDLRSRLPFLSALSDANAWVGSSLTTGLAGAYVNGLEVCLDVDPATIRFGHVSVGTTLGVMPMAAQVDGFTGPELADVIVAGLLTPDEIALLSTAEHDGWTYRFVDWKLAVTASDDTVYWMQPFCCVNVIADLPSFEGIIREYLDATVDEPA